MGGNRRQIIAPIVLLVLLACLTAYMAISHSLARATSERWVAHTYLVIDTVQRRRRYRGSLGLWRPIFGRENARHNWD